MAAIGSSAPAGLRQGGDPADWLAGPDTFPSIDIGPGDEMMVLGYPAGAVRRLPPAFPILRSGRVGLADRGAATLPTFLLDFRVFPGNSGGPGVHRPRRPAAASGAAEAQEVQFVAGMLTQQVELNNERLEIGIVTDAKFVTRHHRPPGSAAALARAAPPPPPPETTPPPPPDQVSRNAAAAVGDAVAD